MNNQITSTLKLSIILLSVTVLSIACSDDNGDGTDPIGIIDINDADAVASSITIDNALVLDGNPPSPSNDPQAPVIEDIGNLVTTIGGVLAVEIDVASGNVGGIYFQIQGANSYFDAPLNGDTGDESILNIGIPEGLGVGVFCAEVCVYDTELKVSNVVVTCVEITAPGGVNSDFLTTVDVWEALSFKETINDVTEEYEIGELIVDSFSTQLLCADGVTFEEVEISESSRTDLLEITFSQNGGVSVLSEEFERSLDFDNSTCEEQVFIEVETRVELQGSWSYDDLNKELVLALEVISNTGFPEDVGEIEVVKFEVDFDSNDNILRLTQESDGVVETITFQPE